MHGTLKVLAVLTALACVTNVAFARPYKWCIDGPGDTPRCDFKTLKQCKASASGLDADCTINPKLLFGNKHSARKTVR